MQGYNTIDLALSEPPTKKVSMRQKSCRSEKVTALNQNGSYRNEVAAAKKKLPQRSYRSQKEVTASSRKKLPQREEF